MELFNNTREFWTKLKIEDIIGIQDKQEIESQLEDGKTLGETNFEVKNIRTFSAEGKNGILATYLLIELEDVADNEILHLIVKMVDNTIALRLAFMVQEFEPGDRCDIVGRGDQYIFEEPEDVNNFKFSDLEYAYSITQDIDGDSIEFNQLPQGELNGSCIYNPKESGMGDIFMTLVEYSTDVDCDNPYLMIVEEEELEPDKGDDWDYADDIDDEDDYDEECFDSPDYEEEIEEDEEEEEDNYGGLITIYMGTDISPLDLNVYPKGK